MVSNGKGRNTTKQVKTCLKLVRDSKEASVVRMKQKQWNMVGNEVRR